MTQTYPRNPEDAYVPATSSFSFVLPASNRYSVPQSPTFNVPSLLWTRTCTGHGPLLPLQPHHLTMGRITAMTRTTRSHCDITRVKASPVSYLETGTTGCDVPSTSPPLRLQE